MPMDSLDITDITDTDVDAVVALWQACGLTRPWNAPEADIAFARSCDNATVLVGRKAGAVVASAMVGHDGHRGTVYYVAVAPERQGHGLGRAMMDAAEGWLRARGVWKLNLMVRAENEQATRFYEALGYAVEERLNLAKWIDPSKKPG